MYVAALPVAEVSGSAWETAAHIEHPRATIDLLGKSIDSVKAIRALNPEQAATTPGRSPQKAGLSSG